MMNRVHCRPCEAGPALRRCAAAPWTTLRALFGDLEAEEGAAADHAANDATNGEAGSPETKPEPSNMREQRAVDTWAAKVHPRAHRLIAVKGGVERTLRNLSEGIKTSPFELVCDMDSDKCVIWEGFKTQSRDPMVKMVRPDKETWIYANRAVAFLFADDEHYRMWQSLDPQRPLKMSCGNKMCVCLGHISANLDQQRPSPASSD